jgi:hypothetical protein
MVVLRDTMIIRRPRRKRGMSMRMVAPTGGVSPE